MKVYVRTVALIGLNFFLYQPVNAAKNKFDIEQSEERQLSSFDAKGIHLGSFFLYPVMKLDNEYNSNIFRRDSKIGEVDSYIAHFRPGFTLISDWGRHALNLTFNTDLAVYSAQSEENYEDVSLDLNGRLDVLRDSTLNASFSYDKLHEGRGSPDQLGGRTPTLFDNKSVVLNYKHKFNRVSLRPAFQFSRIDYDNTPTTSTTGDLKQKTRSRWEFTPSMRIGYEMSSGYEAFTEFLWRDISYDNAVVSGASTNVFLRDSYGYNILAGMAFDLTSLITGDISIGYFYRNYEDTRLPTISGINGFINLSWHPTPLTHVLFSFSRDIEETTQAGVSGRVATSPSINVAHELLRNVVLNIGASYQYNEYNGFDVNNANIANRTDRLEDVFGANLGVKYFLNRNINMELAYKYDSRDVNYTLSDYEVHQVMFNISVQF
ncbi:MAG: outer membrane beta-barrel protein [Methylococcales bacterium]|nr:outer membrane beta-barrel protein [Methylococcales bacterium]